MATRRLAPGQVLSRYLLREFAGALLPVIAAFVILYLIVDFFDRLDILLRHHAQAGAAVRYFLFKIPLMITQILPPAVLAAVLLSLGMLARRNEITALRASGVSLLQMALPLLAAAAVISAGTLLWNETVVPYSTRMYERINNVEIRKREERALLSDRGLWYHGGAGFYNIDYVDARRSSLVGLRIFQTDASFQLQRIVEVPWARWEGTRWVTSELRERTIGPDGSTQARVLPPNGTLIPETLDDFIEVHRKPEELSYLGLRERVAELSRKGIDASNYLVDLQLKLAVPFTSLVLAAIAIPVAGRVRRHPSIAASVGIGLGVGFGYWVVLGLTSSLGEGGALPPTVAAWAANVIFGLIACALFLGNE